jgi:hypothetical protein
MTAAGGRKSQWPRNPRREFPMTQGPRNRGPVVGCAWWFGPLVAPEPGWGGLPLRQADQG